MYAYVNTVDKSTGLIKLATTTENISDQQSRVSVVSFVHDNDEYTTDAGYAAISDNPLIASTDRYYNGKPYFFYHLCSYNVSANSNISVTLDGKPFTDYVAEFKKYTVSRSMSTQFITYPTFDNESWVTKNDEVSKMRILVTKPIPHLEVQYTTSENITKSEILTFSAFTGAEDGKKVYYKVSKHKEPIINGSAIGNTWNIYVGCGTYGNLKIPPPTISTKRVKCRPSKISGNRIYLPLVPIASQSNAKVEVSGDGSNKIATTDKLNGILYMKDVVKNTEDVIVEYDHWVIEHLLNYPQLSALDTNNVTYLIGLSDTTIVYKNREQNDGPWYSCEFGPDVQYSEATPIGAVSISPNVILSDVKPDKSIGGGISVSATRKHQDFYTDIGSVDGVPIPGSKVIDIMLPSYKRNQIAANFAKLNRSDGDTIDDHIEKADDLIKDRLRAILPAGAYFRVIYKD